MCQDTGVVANPPLLNPREPGVLYGGSQLRHVGLGSTAIPCILRSDTTMPTRHSRDDIVQQEYRSIYPNDDRTLYLDVVAEQDKLHPGVERERSQQVDF